ncbi:tyrosine-protein phosphatase [Flavihumibacter stibioxidans]|uniref:protein-tyrosine-phosphatase n=1 Tax=Flavihumibacter stibioxidans TaxID=1834163 RepID=A0ABR7M7L6_9BACT|nr:CpsB/CapC family capsule biosynthesis tyrosine phosphatase [Flavihumibacter stibioxidans]MBC6491010.1 hypothetical protein [Flavihumibacter stibioxidans]
MFSIFRRNKPSSRIDLSGIGTDMHSHLLPGIDDGSPDTDTSLELIKGLEELGFRNFITTPHVLWDLYRNTDETIGQAGDELKLAAERAGRSLQLSAAAEYMMDDHFTEMLRNKVPLRTLAQNFVLVEFSFVSLPFDWKQVFFDLQIQGYIPVLAHPERYNYLSAQPSIFREIADMGVLLQVNLNSLTGYYGKPALQLAQWLIKQNLVSFLGSDLHHQRHLEALRVSPSLQPMVEHILDNGRLLNSLWT